MAQRFRHLMPAFVLAAAIASCFSEPPPVMERVAMKVTAANGAVVYVEYDTLGDVRTGRVSGDETPVVQQDSTKVAATQVREIFDAARALDDSMLRHEGPAPAEPRGSAVVAILWTDRSQSRIVWPADSVPTNPALKRLVDRITAHKPGGW